MKKLAGSLLICLTVIFPASLSADTSWKSAIEAVSKKSGRYYDYALSLGSGHAGSALHGIGHDRHICAIVGRMLGFRAEIQEAETFEDPPLTPKADPYELMVHSLFLDSWVAAARRAISMTERQKKSLWNLECIGSHGIPKTAFIAEPGLVADFSISGETLVVYGDIDAEFYWRFLKILSQNSQIETVALGSAGGSVVDAMLAGLEIRNRGLETTLHGPCFSACPLVFMGGTQRIIWMGPGPHLGFHRVYSSSGEVSTDDKIYWQIADYLTAMGVDPKTVLRWMLSAGPNEIFEPRLDQLCKPGVATWVQRVCGP